jgi:glycosyltransferase involved in cell wall biosynthesis
MTKILVVNWNDIKNHKTETEMLFDDINRAVFGEMVTLKRAIESIDLKINIKKYYRNCIIDRALAIGEYIKNYEKLFDVDLIIADDMALSLSKINTPLISVCENPYLSMAKFSLEHNFLNKLGFFESGLLLNGLQRTQMSKSKGIVSISKFMQEYAKSFGIKSDVIHGGIDTDFWSPLSEDDQWKMRDELGLPYDKKIGVISTIFHPSRNWKTAVDIIRKRKDIFWAVCFQEVVEKEPRLKNVKIFNTPGKETLRKIFGSSDFFLSVSPFEGFNLPALYAMSCNIPVITSKSGWFWEIEQYYSGDEPYYPTDFGIIVKDPLDVKSFDNCITHFICDHFEFRPRDSIDFYGLDFDEFAAKWEFFIKRVLNL